MQFSIYNSEKITKLMEVAGKNISNNIDKLKEEIQGVIEQKRHDWWQSESTGMKLGDFCNTWSVKTHNTNKKKAKKLYGY